jgi:hypothetical protein
MLGDRNQLASVLAASVLSSISPQVLPYHLQEIIMKYIRIYFYHFEYKSEYLMSNLSGPPQENENGLSTYAYHSRAAQTGTGSLTCIPIHLDN